MRWDRGARLGTTSSGATVYVGLEDGRPSGVVIEAEYKVGDDDQCEADAAEACALAGIVAGEGQLDEGEHYIRAAIDGQGEPDPDAHAAAQEQAEADRLDAEEAEAADREAERDGTPWPSAQERRWQDEDTPTCGRCGCTLTDPVYLHCDECVSAHGLPATIAERAAREAR